jgi:hypothetical protein
MWNRLKTVGAATLFAGVAALALGLDGWAEPCSSATQSIDGRLVELHVREWSRCAELVDFFAAPIFAGDAQPLSASMSSRLTRVKGKTILGLSAGVIAIVAGVFILARAFGSETTGVKRTGMLMACLLGSALFVALTFGIYMEKLETLEWRKTLELSPGFAAADPGNLVSHRAIARQQIVMWVGGLSCLALTVWVAVRRPGDK